MFKKVKNWIVDKWKKLLIILGFTVGIVLAAPLVIDQPLDISQETILEKYNLAIEIQEDYILENAKFIKPAKNENSIKIEVGEDGDEFIPNFKISRWEDEVWFKIKPRLTSDKKDRSLKLEGKKIKFKTPKKEFHFYELATSTLIGYDPIYNYPIYQETEHPKGAYECEIILLEKPDSNVITFDIETKDLVFYYQPPLNEEMASSTCTPTDCGGSHRPENIVGSYAVYHISKRDNKYKAGKAFHIPKPQMEDANGWKIWGEFNTDLNNTGKLKVTIPQDFLDKAVYPVRHATGLEFGYSTLGGSVQNPGYAAVGQKSTPTESGVVDDITIGVDGQSIGDEHTGQIYDGVTNADPIANGETDPTDLVVNTKAWIALPYSGIAPEIEASTEYVLTFDYDHPGVGYTQIAYDSVGNKGYWYGSTYREWPANKTFTFFDLNNTYSIYANYTKLAPSVTTDIATSSGQTSVNFKGFVDVNIFEGGDAAFEYGTTVTFGATTTPQVLTASSTFYFNQTGLTTLTPYYYRAVYSSSTEYVLGDTYLVMAGDVATTTQIDSQWDAGTYSSMESSGDNLIIILDSGMATGSTESFESVSDATAIDSGSQWNNPVATCDWLGETTDTPSSPTGATDGSDGTVYAVVETSASFCNSNGNTAIMQHDGIGCASGCDGQICFDYNMFGADIGTLKLQFYDESDVGWGDGVFTKTGQQTDGSTWITVCEDFSDDDVSGIRFHYTAAGGFLGDAAVDYVRVATGSAEATTGTWTSNSLDLSDITSADGSKIDCSTTTPANTELSLYTGINSSATVAPTSWDLAHCGNTITNVTGDLSSNYLWSKIIATSTNGIANIAVDWLAYGINLSGAPPAAAPAPKPEIWWDE